MKKVKVGMFGLNDMLKFKNMKSKRLSGIAGCSTDNRFEESNTNIVAKVIHPKIQKLVVADIISETWDCKTFILKAKDGETLAPFKAGQYVNVFVEIDGERVSRAYSLSSSPKQAREGEYRITVKAVHNGLVSNYLLGTLDVGEELIVSSPMGNLTYNPLRDEQHIVGIAGGSGITPFYSLAQAIIDGDENCILTIFYGAKKEDDIIFLEQLDDIVSKTNKVKVIYVLSNESNSKYEHGYITKEIIDKYVEAKSSFFMSGPENMYTFLSNELAKYNLPNKYFRLESPTPQSMAKGQKFKMIVRYNGEEIKTMALENETLMTSLYRANIVIPSGCHAGTCGYCRTKLVAGEIVMSNDFRRGADKKYNYIHPCVTYPKSDLIIEIVK